MLLASKKVSTSPAAITPAVQPTTLATSWFPKKTRTPRGDGRRVLRTTRALLATRSGRTCPMARGVASLRRGRLGSRIAAETPGGAPCTREQGFSVDRLRMSCVSSPHPENGSRRLPARRRLLRRTCDRSHPAPEGPAPRAQRVAAVPGRAPDHPVELGSVAGRWPSPRLTTDPRKV